MMKENDKYMYRQAYDDFYAITNTSTACFNPFHYYVNMTAFNLLRNARSSPTIDCLDNDRILILSLIVTLLLRLLTSCFHNTLDC